MKITELINLLNQLKEDYCLMDEVEGIDEIMEILRNIKTSELRSKCCRAKLLEDKRYRSPHRLTYYTPKCSKCRKPCEVENM